MKRAVIIISLMIFLALELIHLFAFPSAHAAEPDPTPEPVATVMIKQSRTKTTDPITKPKAVIYDYHVGVDQINAVARGMWGLNTDSEKRGYAFLVVNRTLSNATDADGNRLFDGTIGGNAARTDEFFFYDADAPVSDRNYELAKLYINAQLTFLITKAYTGYPFPSTMLYMQWDGETLSFTTDLGEEPWYYGDQ